jgi:hypothetical protein
LLDEIPATRQTLSPYRMGFVQHRSKKRLQRQRQRQPHVGESNAKILATMTFKVCYSKTLLP